jgi:hypothetical protein
MFEDEIEKKKKALVQNLKNVIKKFEQNVKAFF